jgi:hypothetical protein
MPDEKEPEKYVDKNGNPIPDDAFENEPSATPLDMTDEEIDAMLPNDETPKE